ncbi:MAG: hypothetical protein WAM92_06480 [Mycobacterium sp.]
MIDEPMRWSHAHVKPVVPSSWQMTPQRASVQAGLSTTVKYVDGKLGGMTTMALWDEAQQKSEEIKNAQQARDEREQRKAEEERERVKAQVQAVAEFVEAMNRLRIKPVKRQLSTQSGSTFFGTRGWDIDSPREPRAKPHYFVTPKGQVHSFLKKRPEDLSNVVSDPIYDTNDHYYLTERLRDGLARAMAGD